MRKFFQHFSTETILFFSLVAFKHALQNTNNELRNNMKLQMIHTFSRKVITFLERVMRAVAENH